MKTRSMIRGTPSRCLSKLPSFLSFKLGQYVEERFAAHFSNLPLKARHFCILRVLEHNAEPLSQQELCEALWIDRATMTGMIKELTALKFIARLDSNSDKRRVLITLTRAGRKFYRASWRGFEKLEMDIYHSLSTKELLQLKTLLHRVLLAISAKEN